MTIFYQLWENKSHCALLDNNSRSFSVSLPHLVLFSTCCNIFTWLWVKQKTGNEYVSFKRSRGSLQGKTYLMQVMAIPRHGCWFICKVETNRQFWLNDEIIICRLLSETWTWHWELTREGRWGYRHAGVALSVWSPRMVWCHSPELCQWINVLITSDQWQGLSTTVLCCLR